MSHKVWITDLCPEIAEWQAELIAEHIDRCVQREREACEQLVWDTHDDEDQGIRTAIAQAILARNP